MIPKRKGKTSFDDFANDYRAIHSENVKKTGADSYYFAEHKVLELKKKESPQDALRLLDIGCGDGATELFIQKHFPLWQIEGIDVSEKSIQYATDKDIRNTHFRVYNGSVIPFDKDSFDIVFMSCVLHHIDFNVHFNILSEVYRVLRPAGRLFLFEHNPLNPFTRYLVRTCIFDKDAKLLSYGYTKKLIKKFPYRSVNRKFILFFPRKGFLSALTTSEDYLGWLPLGAQYYYVCTK